MILSKQVEDATGPVLLNSELEQDGSAGRSIVILNQGAGIVYLGGEDVDATSGYPVAVGDEYSFDLRQGDKLYAFGTDIDLIVLQVGI